MDRLLAAHRALQRTTEWLAWDMTSWIYRRAMGIEIEYNGDEGRPRDSPDVAAVSNVAATTTTTTTTTTIATADVAPPSSLFSSRGREDTPSRRPGSMSIHDDGRDAPCRSEVCRYCRAVEKTLLWEDFTFFVNIYLIIVLNVTIWIYGLLGVQTLRVPFSILTVYFVVQIFVAFKFMDILAPAAAPQRVCSRFHWLWKNMLQLRMERPGLHCAILCLLAIGLWLLRRINLSTPHSIYWGIVLGPLILRLPFKLSDKVSEYFMSHREWQCDSEIEDEFLPMVTEANLQVLNRVGETGDHSPTPTSVVSDTQNDSFYDEDFIEGLQEIAFSAPYGEGSTDGVELSELDLSVGENEAEEDDIKFQSGHFEKSSSSSEEEIFDAKKIAAVSSDESNIDSDFEIIDKEEIAKIEM